MNKIVIVFVQFIEGMEKELSVYCAIIGDREFVLLDSPSTGMDLVSRRERRTIISNKGSQDVLNTENKISAILTTHSMDNRNAFYPRIVAMAKSKRRYHGCLAKDIAYTLQSQIWKLQVMITKI